jgi:hypothetical protein
MKSAALALRANSDSHSFVVISNALKQGQTKVEKTGEQRKTLRAADLIHQIYPTPPRDSLLRQEIGGFRLGSATR